MFLNVTDTTFRMYVVGLFTRLATLISESLYCVCGDPHVYVYTEILMCIRLCRYYVRVCAHIACFSVPRI